MTSTTERTIQVEEYFRTARERYQIMLNRAAGMPLPWTVDPVLASWRFCNVHREDDRTTVWFRRNVRDRVSTAYGMQAMVKATIAFRWFNRIETAERIVDMLVDPTKWSTDEATRRLDGYSPVVTGAYIVNGKPGYDKLTGVLLCIEDAFHYIDRHPTECEWPSLESAWQDLCMIPYLGRFMAYEVVSDLRWTPVLNGAVDIMTWANAGPGCARGLSRVMWGHPDGYNAGSRTDQGIMLERMQMLLELSRSEECWPQDWRSWEMREAEHWSCELDKYQRAAVDGQRLKRRYK